MLRLRLLLARQAPLHAQRSPLSTLPKAPPQPGGPRASQQPQPGGPGPRASQQPLRVYQPPHRRPTSAAPAPQAAPAGGPRPWSPEAAAARRAKSQADFLPLVGQSVAQTLHVLDAGPHARVMSLVNGCPYANFMSGDAPQVLDRARNFLLALSMHLEQHVGHAPPYARLPDRFAPADADMLLNLFKQFGKQLRPPMQVMAALLERAGARGVRAQRALQNAQLLGVQCPTQAFEMAASEASLLRGDPSRVMHVGPKAMRNLLGIMKQVRMPELAEALALALLHVARESERGSETAAAFWRSWRDPVRCPNPNLHATLLTDLAGWGASAGSMREVLPAVGGQLLLAGQGDAHPSRALAVGGYGLLLRAMAGLALDEGSVSAEEVAAHPGRSLEAYLRAARPLMTLATTSINSIHASAPPGYFDWLVGLLSTYHSRADVAGEVKAYDASVPLPPAQVEELRRWLRNVSPARDSIGVHYVAIELSNGVVSANGVLEALRSCPRAGPLLQGVPPLAPAMVEVIQRHLHKSRSAEREAHSHLRGTRPLDAQEAGEAGEELGEGAPAAGAGAGVAPAAAAAAAAASPAASLSTPILPAPPGLEVFAASLSWMQQVATLRVQAVIAAAAGAARAAAGGGGGGGSSSKGCTISGVALTAAQAAALGRLGQPSHDVSVYDFSLDLAWPAQRLALEIDGPLHFESLTASEMAGALAALGGTGGNAEAAAMGAGDGTFFSAPGLPSLVDWSVAASRYKVTRVGLSMRAEAVRRAAAARAGSASASGAAPAAVRLTGGTDFRERVRTAVIARLGWRVAHVNFLEIEAQVPMLVRFLRGAPVQDSDGGASLAAHRFRARYLELSVEDLVAARAEMAQVAPHIGDADLAKAAAGVDAVIIRVLLEQLE